LSARAEARGPWWLRALARLATAVAGALLAFACATLPPRDVDDACAIYAERDEWRDAALRASERWELPASVILAIIHQESRFRAEARPGWRLALGFVPVGPASSAYGYGQAQAGTWDDYRSRSGNRGADRDDFADVADFIGWYADVIHRRTGVAKHDAFHLYLAYHEGPAGYARRTFDTKPWLLGVARKVSERASLYEAQSQSCRA
jgi:hypothetical protein